MGQVVAIIDIDCAVENGFDEEDQAKLEELAQVLGKATYAPLAQRKR